ncbi:hypothetical protein IVB69_02270 [Flavobacterium sp. J49]|uniref:hypothetical protein n=1 Tax=Flavobacterium sp. J49 TaxID=2718534 RepID=UPI0015939F59|nr:hypothetical protein [Flavobacterium sp. J49]MBF6640297.1 hypothetical protein [Flavobacterium sp. J49]NIC01542.1 hypothetical protein [Flavobacterium sp. J49]
MPDNNLFYVPSEHESLLDYVKNLLKSIPYSEQNTKDGTVFTIHFPSSLEKLEFFATIKRNYPQLLG